MELPQKIDTFEDIERAINKRAGTLIVGLVTCWAVLFTAWVMAISLMGGTFHLVMYIFGGVVFSLFGFIIGRSLLKKERLAYSVLSESETLIRISGSLLLAKTRQYIAVQDYMDKVKKVRGGYRLTCSECDEISDAVHRANCLKSACDAGYLTLNTEVSK